MLFILSFANLVLLVHLEEYRPKSKTSVASTISKDSTGHYWVTRTTRFHSKECDHKSHYNEK